MRLSEVFFGMMLGLFLFSGCKQRVYESSIERKNEPTVYNVPDENEEVNKAIEIAKKTLIEFDKAFTSGNPDFEFFAIKQAFPYSDGDEHIWIGNLFKEEKDYWGVIDNQPVYDIGYKYGDTIKINNNLLSDWIYYDKGVVIGGFTIRAIRNSMTESEKERFDYENGFLFNE